MPSSINRRTFLQWAGAAALGTFPARGPAQSTDEAKGLVTGQPHAAKAGMDILAAGGNAVDAAVAAALAAGVAAVSSCGIGGYGGHLVIAFPSGKTTAIDFNTTAPAAARPDMFPLDERGQVKGQVNTYGWLAASVPGTLAGLQLALNRYGTLPLVKVLQPAIRLARDGFEVSRSLAGVIKAAAGRLKNDPGSARLLFKNGEPLREGDTLRNPDLAALLEKLAGDNSVRAFYRGEIARRIAAAFKQNGGLVTADDLAAYQAREVEPLQFTWRGRTIVTAPLTAGGLTVLQALATLRALGWEGGGDKATHARLEALRLAWHDRLTLLGDPEKVEVPVARLLSKAYAEQSAERVGKAVKEQKPVPGASDGRSTGGTTHLCAADGKGLMVALTLTHGGSFGACVAVDGLGLLLGHGMSRFDPRPRRPNSPGPGKRPLHNMCPTMVLQDGRPVAALGAIGGRRIPNALFDVLVNLVGLRRSLSDAVQAPRMHTEGGLDLTCTAGWLEAELDHLKKVGYAVKSGPAAALNAIARDAATGRLTTAAR
jgi:gamma-glutamyltranspeptidase/glutathione hydrolase